MSKRSILLLASVLAVAALAAGCGGSDDDSTNTGTGGSTNGDTTTAALTKAEFIEKGDAICEKANESIEDEADDFAKENDIDTSKPTQKQKEEVIVAVVAPSVRTQSEEIAELGAPSGDEDQVEEIIVSLEDATAEIEDDPSLVFEGEPLKEAGRLAEDYGFEVCGEE